MCLCVAHTSFNFLPVDDCLLTANAAATGSSLLKGFPSVGKAFESRLRWKLSPAPRDDDDTDMTRIPDAQESALPPGKRVSAGKTIRCNSFAETCLCLCLSDRSHV